MNYAIVEYLLLSLDYSGFYFKNRDRLFERLWLDIEQEPYLAKIIAAERQDLWQEDVLFFTTHPIMI